MKWETETEKPEPYKTVLLALVGDDFTTGYWADRFRLYRWMGYAFDRSPPIYRLAKGSVIGWAEIEPIEVVNDR